jgi:hypothetical protein
MKILYVILFIILLSSCNKFGSYQCTQDCSWHKAGYNWAEDKWINNQNDCGWKSNSFIEWCKQYVSDNQ